MNFHLLSSLRLLGAAVVLAVAGLSTATAIPFVRSIEKDIETSSSDVSIPASAPATVLVPICSSACPNSLVLTANTRTYIGRTAVTLVQLHDYTTNHRVGMTLFYDPVSKALNRVIADEQRK